MESDTLTIEHILETLTPEEREEVLQNNFRIPLQLYLDGYNRNPDWPKESLLHRFKSYARNRVSVKSAIEKNPDILKVEIKEPVFIIGLARTGTTMLQRLLDADPKLSAPMLWELVEPAPAGRPENFEECDRYKKACKDEDSASLVEDHFINYHHSKMDLPEECYNALRPYFMNFYDFVQLLDLPELRDFMYNFPEQQALDTYEYYKRCLQCIFYDSLPAGHRVLLKSSIHCLNLRTIKKVFPDAKFLFPIRNVKSMVASYCSFIYQIWKSIDEEADVHACGKRVLELFKYESQNAVKFFREAPEGCYLPFSYSEMTKNPIETVKQINAHFGWDLTPEAIELMQKHAEENKQNKHGKVEKTKIEDYGLTEEDIKENLKEYLEFFADGPERICE